MVPAPDGLLSRGLVMNSTAVLGLAPKLAQAVLDDEWRVALILAADLKAAVSEEQKFSPWTPAHPRNAS